MHPPFHDLRKSCRNQNLVKTALHCICCIFNICWYIVWMRLLALGKGWHYKCGDVAAHPRLVLPNTSCVGALRLASQLLWQKTSPLQSPGFCVSHIADNKVPEWNHLYTNESSYFILYCISTLSTCHLHKCIWNYRQHRRIHRKTDFAI